MSLANHPNLTELIALIGSAGTPQFVRVCMRSDATPLDCFQNAAREVARAGGKVIHGWWVKAVPDILIEAQFHAVVRTARGDLFDPTPDKTSSHRRFFIPDLVRTYEGHDVMNLKVRLTDDPHINREMDFCDYLDRAMAALPRFFAASELDRIAREFAQAFSLPPGEARNRVARHSAGRL